MLTKIGLPLFAVAAIALAVVSVKQNLPAETKVDPPAPPPTAKFAKQVGAVGLVEASTENISVSLPVPGLVTQVFVTSGQKVAKGQPLFALDSRDLKAELALRQSALQLAQARLERLRQSPRPEEIPPAEARVRDAAALLSDAQVQLQLMEGVRDKRAIRQEDLERRRRAVQSAQAKLDEAKAALALLKAGTWSPDLKIAEAEVAQAEAAIARVQADLDRLTVAAPISGQILQLKVRAGEYASAGPLQQPLVVMGAVDQLHVRADIDERDAQRLSPSAPAMASVRGEAGRKYALSLVRIEPLVIPKRNLTGDGGERVDTRVLQAVYALEKGAPVYPGQQMDVFIEAK